MLLQRLRGQLDNLQAENVVIYKDKNGKDPKVIISNNNNNNKRLTYKRIVPFINDTNSINLVKIKNKFH